MMNSLKSIFPTMNKVETICALATNIGQSGIGVVRVSGPLSKLITKKVLNVEPALYLVSIIFVWLVVRLVRIASSL